MKVGDRIRVQRHIWGYRADIQDFTIEEFRHCLGFFEDDGHRQAGRFTPLCEMYEAGPESKPDYISNFGEYTTNMVQAWMDIPNNIIED